MCWAVSCTSGTPSIRSVRSFRWADSNQGMRDSNSIANDATFHVVQRTFCCSHHADHQRPRVPSEEKLCGGLGQRNRCPHGNGSTDDRALGTHVQERLFKSGRQFFFLVFSGEEMKSLSLGTFLH